MKVIWIILALSLAACNTMSSDRPFNDNVSWRALKMDQQRHGKTHIIGRWDSDTGWHGYGNKTIKNRSKK